MSEYKRGLFEYTGPVEPKGPEVQAGDHWYNTKDNVVCKRETNGFWNCGYPGVGFIFGGGYTGAALSSIEAFIFANDATVSKIGNSITSYYSNTCCNSSNFVYSQCGTTSATTCISLVEKITARFGASNATQIGNINSSRCYGFSFNSSAHGFFTNGFLIGVTYLSIIDRIVFNNDSATASNVGSTNNTRAISCGANSSLYGYMLGSDNLASCELIGFPFDSGLATAAGNLSKSVGSVASGHGINSSLYGYVAYYNSSVISRLSFPFNAGTSSDVGFESFTNSYYGGGCNSTLYGYIAGGRAGTNQVSTIQRFGFPLDSGTCSNVGVMSTTRFQNSAVDNTDFVQQFI